MATLAASSPNDPRRVLEEVLALSATKPIEACRDARRAVRTWPDFPPAYRVLAFVLRKANREREADAADLKSIEISERRPAMVAARQAFAEGRREEAELLIREHLKSDPEDASGAKVLADIAVVCGAVREAEIFFKRALLLAPGYHEARLSLVMLLNRLQREKEAMALLEHVLAREPDHLAALSLKAGILAHQRRLSEADRLFRKLLARHPNSAMSWVNYAFLLKTNNRLDDSVVAYRKALALERSNGPAWWGLANLKTVRFNSADVAVMRASLAQADATDDQRLHLHFALGKALHDFGDFAAAFENYREGNRIRRSQFRYDSIEITDDVRKVERVFTPALIAKRSGVGAQDRDPIFIVSMPRSGSTLVEQILASHPLIEGTEELYDVERIARELGGEGPAGAYLDNMIATSPEKLHAMGERYLTLTKDRRKTSRPFFTDKMPNNWKFVGLINFILPNAKIIDVRRHPLGCGFANFTQNYNWGINFSYDLVDIGKFYRDYVRQMKHFDCVMPGRVHRIFYENLVDNFEVEVRRLLDHLGLPFDEACLNFYQNKRAVYTPSSEQVRRPINRDGMDKWRHYEPWLTPLKEALGKVLDEYPAIPADISSER